MHDFAEGMKHQSPTLALGEYLNENSVVLDHYLGYFVL